MKNYQPILLQAAVWIGIWTLFAFTGSQESRDAWFYYMLTFRVLGFALFFNLVYYALLPLFFNGRKRAFYAFSVLAFLAYIGLSVSSDWWHFHAHVRNRTEVRQDRGSGPRLFYFFIPPVFLSMVLFGAAATFRGFSAFERKKAEEEEANRRRLEAEIALLKSQINPHFLLNTLNNLYALALTEPEKTPDALYKLSGMVSYILYECASPTVPLKRDLEFIGQYIELQGMRLPPNATLDCALPEDAPDDLEIEPMILIPFIENAFKHGLTTKRPVTLSVGICLDGQKLHMRVENPILPPRELNLGNPSGIGMVNTRKRLEHSYAGKYQLKVNDTEGKHEVDLTLNLRA